MSLFLAEGGILGCIQGPVGIESSCTLFNPAAKQLLMLRGRLDRRKNHVLLDGFLWRHFPLDDLLVQQALFWITGNYRGAMCATQEDQRLTAEVQAGSQLSTPVTMPAVNAQHRGNI